MGGSQEVMGGGETGRDIEVDSGFMSDFVEGVVPAGSFGGSDDFAGGVDVFDDSGTESCSQ